MTDFLTAVSSTQLKKSAALVQEVGSARQRNAYISIGSPEEALKALKDEPDFDTVSRTLDYLHSESQRKDGFNLITPDPLSANIAYQLVNTTIPDYWRSFEVNKPQIKQLVSCLQNPSGLGAIINRLRPLIADCRKKNPAGSARNPSEHVEDLVQVLERVLADDLITTHIWESIKAHAKSTTQQKLMWKEFISQIASGRILSLAAEAADVLKEKDSAQSTSWLAKGAEYASWLGRNISLLMREMHRIDDSKQAVLEICGKVFSLGYTDHIVSSMLLGMIEDESIEPLYHFFSQMKSFEQRKYIIALVAFSSKYFATAKDKTADATLDESPAISGMAALFHGTLNGNDSVKDMLLAAVIKSAIPKLDDSLATRRSIIAALAQDEERIQNLLEESLKLFGDSFYIRHTPILQQEALAQTLAITSGYIQRSQPMFLTMMAKSSYQVTGMSNRIGATSLRARFLGMAVGVALSRMVDKPETQLKFDLEGTEADEAGWYQQLTEVNDKLGSTQDLKSHPEKKPIKHNLPYRGTEKAKASSVATNKPAITEISGPRIVEILDDSEDDDDLIPYEKPDSDPEDDTDDPTEINRNKPTAPVYIRDLIAGLREQEDVDRHELALTTAAPLIKRKSNFGTEVLDHIEELATILAGLNDSFNLPNFLEKRQQALIAVLLAKPGPMAQWFARSFFSGDYSYQQRVAMLTTLGLGARELAGLKDSSTEDFIPTAPSFPSKTLPDNLHKIYAPDTDPVAKVTSGLAKQLLSPIAASAADQLSGPDILKVRTFSSRMEVEKRRKKPIPNALAQVVADNFFFPLTGRWWIAVRADSDSMYTSTHLLPPFLHTLALLMNASGPSTLALPQMTRELWDLLLSVRGVAGKDKAVLGALLFAFLMLLETNEDKERLATEQSKELLETQEWVRMVFEGLGSGSEEDEKVRVLAAGVLVRAQEVVERYQRRLIGSMMDY